MKNKIALFCLLLGACVPAALVSNSILLRANDCSREYKSGDRSRQETIKCLKAASSSNQYVLDRWKWPGWITSKENTEAKNILNRGIEDASSMVNTDFGVTRDSQSSERQVEKDSGTESD